MSAELQTGENRGPEAQDGPPRVAAPRERLLSLDVFRGMTIAGMLLVNNPGDWGHIYPPLAHARWHGWTPTDLIFPFFLFIVGITTHLSLSARKAAGASDGMLVRQILRRGLLIILFGLLLNAFPFYTWSTIEGVEVPTFLQRVLYRFDNLRFSGVLQRIGLVYIASALLSLNATVRRLVLLLAIILLGYWFAMTLLPVPGTGELGGLVLDKPGETLAAWSDRAVLGAKHIYKSAKTWDPEGVLSTIPAIGTALLGIIAGRWIGSRRALPDRLNGLFAIGAMGIVTGLIWHWSFPINKNLWTSSYVVFTAGMSSVTLATCMWIIDEKKIRGWTWPFEAFGVNPIAAFVGSGLMVRLIGSLIKIPSGGKSAPLSAVIYRSFYTSWLSPINASLLYAISFVLVWLGIMMVMRRKNLILKL
ncbi:MAG TPA: DUF5009 domain-containing protein [Thermoanaerobaculia bacterium]|nr:DUF5009 domain-containing protein [Thermoanaerobaculia bacterium]